MPTRAARPEGNRRLSEGRAAAVRQYLVQVQGVREDRLQAVGKGDPSR